MSPWKDDRGSLGADGRPLMVALLVLIVVVTIGQLCSVTTNVLDPEPPAYVGGIHGLASLGSGAATVPDGSEMRLVRQKRTTPVQDDSVTVPRGAPTTEGR